MKFYERLAKLAGHEVIVATNTSDEDRDIPPGVLHEVGEDYILVRTESEDKGGFAIEGAEWFVNLAMIVNIIHQSDCKKCAINEVEKHE